MRKDFNFKAVIGTTTIISCLVIVFCFIGYILNLIKFIESDFVSPYKSEIVHGIGLVPPIGIITGWVDVGK